MPSSRSGESSWGGSDKRSSDKSNGSDRSKSSRSSVSRVDTSHPAHNPAGERAGNLSEKGWSEYSSGDKEARKEGRDYVSTSDRMDRHLSRYGKDKDYTQKFNSFRNNHSKATDSLKNGGFGGSAISIAVNTARGSFSPNKVKSLAGEPYEENVLLASMPDNKIESVMGAGFNEFIDNYNTELPSGKTLGQIGFTDDFSSNYIAGIKNATTGKPIETGVNSLSSVLGSDVGGFVASKLGGNLGAVAGMAAGALTSKAGTAINAINNAYNQKDLSEANKLAQDLGQKRFESEYDKNKSGLGTFGTFLAGMANPVLGIGANFMHSEYATKKAIDAMSHIPGVKENYDQNMQSRIASSKESNAMKALYGGDSETGILSTMRNRQNLAQNNSSTKYNKVSNAIPALANLWDNLQIYKG